MLYSVIARDSDYLEVQPGERIVKGFNEFKNKNELIRHIKSLKNFPVVIKLDGLAAGKGVIVCATRKEAEAALDRGMQKREFGDAGAVAVVEECLAIGAPALWIQEDIVHEAAAEKARTAGMTVVMDRCIYKDYLALM